MAATNNIAASASIATSTFWSNKDNLIGETLLAIAETMSNRAIADAVNENTTDGETPMTVKTVQYRVSRAILARAEQTGQTAVAVKAAHDQVRFANGTKSEAMVQTSVRRAAEQAGQRTAKAAAKNATAYAMIVDSDDEKTEDESPEEAAAKMQQAHRARLNRNHAKQAAKTQVAMSAGGGLQEMEAAHALLALSRGNRR